LKRINRGERRGTGKEPGQIRKTIQSAGVGEGEREEKMVPREVRFEYLVLRGSKITEKLNCTTNRGRGKAIERKGEGCAFVIGEKPRKKKTEGGKKERLYRIQRNTRERKLLKGGGHAINLGGVYTSKRTNPRHTNQLREKNGMFPREKKE